MYGSGPEQPVLLLIGEAPGEFELVDGIPFIGRAGTELMKSLNSIGLTREDVYMTSAVRSRPYRWGKKKKEMGQLQKENTIVHRNKKKSLRMLHYWIMK